MKINDKLLDSAEKFSLNLRELYYGFGYRPYRMSKFEEYDLYAENKEFLVSDNVITFTDTDGKLMALKPDVTLSIIKNSVYAPSEIRKVYYSENVYRATPSAQFKEIMQTGLECFGSLGKKEIVEVIYLAAKSLISVSDNCVLDVSDISVITELLNSLKVGNANAAHIVKAIGDKNFDEMRVVASGADEKTLDLLIKLVKVSGNVKDVLAELCALKNEINSASFNEFTEVLSEIAVSDLADVVRVDFSVVSDVNYYNGIVFRGFVKNVPLAVLSGGQYDRLMRKLKKSGKAIGFAVYLDVLERVGKGEVLPQNDEYLNVALPKGRLGENVYATFAKAGYECPALLSPNRKLVFTNEIKKIRYFWVKPSDVTIYVERGAADVGVAGKDIILEYEPDVYELLDMKLGNCKMAVAAVNGSRYDENASLRVATKFPNIAKKFYMSRGRNIDVINLNGSIEIAPILNLSDVIVDIVETGATLKENNLAVVETICPISARLIANKSASKFKNEQISALLKNLTEAVNDR